MSRGLLLIVICGMFLGQVKAQPKNVLTLHFEQEHFTSAVLPADSVFSITYSLHCPKLCNFHGFEIDVTFQTEYISIEPLGTDVVDYDGGVAALVSNRQATYDPSSGTLRVFVLSDNDAMLDTTNHLLFRYYARIKSTLEDTTYPSTEKGLASVSRVDVLRSSDSAIDSHIDSVAIDNAPHQDPGTGFWDPFPVALFDTTSVPVAKYPLVLSSNAAEIMSDSEGTVGIELAGSDSAVVKNGKFSCIIDTSALRYIGVVPGALINGGSLSASISGDTIDVLFSSSAVLGSAGPLCFLDLQAKHRNDTIVTYLQSPKLVIGNADNRVSVISYKLDSIVILGSPKKKDSVSFVEDGHTAPKVFFVTVLANGTNVECHLSSDMLAGSDRVVIYDALGRLLSEAPARSNPVNINDRLANGFYNAVLIDQNGVPSAVARFTIVH